MSTCPICATPLSTHSDVPGGGHCMTCGGDLLPFALLRKEAPRGALDGLWGELLDAPRGTRPCPCCATPMHAVFRRGIELDGCATCHHVWLDPGERRGLSRPAPLLDGIPMPSGPGMTEAEATRIVAIAHANAIAAERTRRDRLRPSTWWTVAVLDLLSILS